MGDYIRRNSSHLLNLDKQKAEMRMFYETIKNISGEVDKTLEPHVEKLETQAIQKLEELEKKLLRAEKKNYEEVRRKIHEIKEALFPLGNLQERVDNFIPWYAVYGPAFIELIYKQSTSIEQEFIVLEEEN